MSLSIVDQRDVAVVAYDEATVKGATVSVERTVFPNSAQQHLEEIRDVKNTGKVDVFLPRGYAEPFTVTVRGSDSGEETATLTPEAAA